MTYFNIVMLLIAGLLAITLLDTLGAIASRKMNFKYTYLSIVSFAIYVFIAFWVSKDYGLKPAILINGILGLYDGTIGFWLSLVLRANIGKSAEESKMTPDTQSAITMIVMAIIFAFIGFGITMI
jgi:uncharacterized membrane protein